MVEDISKYGPEYQAAYEDELRACCAGLDRMHPRWRERIPYDRLPLETLARVKRLHVRWNLIVNGRGNWGISLDYKLDHAGRPVKPFVASTKPRYRDDGTQVWDASHVQLLSAPMLAESMKLPLAKVEAALRTYDEAITAGEYSRPAMDPRRWVTEHVEAAKKARTGEAA